VAKLLSPVSPQGKATFDFDIAVFQDYHYSLLLFAVLSYLISEVYDCGTYSAAAMARASDP